MGKANFVSKHVKAPKRKQVIRKEVVLTKPLVKHQLGKKWYDYVTDERNTDVNTGIDVQKIQDEAEALYQRDVGLFNQMQRSKGGSEAAWLSTVLTEGTATDRMTALQLLVQKSPVHASAHITSLVKIAEKKNMREAFSVLSLLRNLFLTDLLPHDRKLVPFISRPLGRLKQLSVGAHHNVERQLILWKFESDLKVIYERFVDAIEKLAEGTVKSIASQACRIALDLLAECPEQEQKLLSFLVNKLGHPNHVLATKVCGYLVELTFRQPKMRGVIVDEVERLIYRKNVSGRTQLYAASFLSQIQLRAGEHDLAANLLKIYFGLFRMLVARSKMEDKILSILLSATNRAYPFAIGYAEKLVKDIDLLYKVLHQANSATAIQTLRLLSQLSSGNESDRFYKALYRRMLYISYSTLLQNQLFELLHHVLKTDINESRVIAFIKRLLQLSLALNAAFAAASLLLISRLTSERPSLLKLSKIAQKLSNGSTSGSRLSLLPDEEDEHFVDAEEPVKLKKDVDTIGGENHGTAKRNQRLNVGSWVHAKNIVLRSEISAYDRSARDPSYARAELAVVSELLLLRHHYHPSVALFASNLLDGIPINYDGNPLVDLTAMRFLDRFAYRNPKTRKSINDNTVKKIFKKKLYDPLGVKKLSVTSKEYLEKKTEEIPVDEQYLHRFATFSMKLSKEEEKNDVMSDFSDIESVNSEEFESFLDRMEPAGKNGAFDIDFAKEFSVERKRKSIGKRSAIEDSVFDDCNVSEEVDDIYEEVDDEGTDEEEIDNEQDSITESSESDGDSVVVTDESSFDIDDYSD